MTLALLPSCKSHHDVVSDKSLTVDSVARSEQHRSIVTIDSVIRSTSLDFDTLDIVVERPCAYGDVPEVVRLRAVRGRISDNRSLQHNQLVVSNRLDTVAYKVAASDSSTEHTASTRLYNPPDGNFLWGLALLLLGIFLLIRTYKK